MSKKNQADKTEGNLYDKILKENAERIFMPLVEQRLGVKIKRYRPLKEKMQTTLEREMDFFYEVVTENGKKFLLHLEFQNKDDPEMLYRKAEYHGMALRRKKMRIEHIVLYFGVKKSKMVTKLDEDQVYRGFDIIDVYAMDTQELLSSQVPEVVILAILSNHPKEQTEAVLRLITSRLKKLSQNKNQLSRYLNQLLVLSRMRKLEKLTSKIVDEMPLTYNIKTDYLYKKGHREGIDEERITTAKEMLLAGIAIEDVVKFSRLTLAKVKKLKAELDKES